MISLGSMIVDVALIRSLKFDRSNEGLKKRILDKTLYRELVLNL